MKPMDENLAGYLLKAEDPETQRDVETYLREHPEAHKRLEQVQHILDPLAADRDEADPPADLWVRTLARVAEYQCRNLPYAPPPSKGQSVPPSRPWWHRADGLVAAALMFVAAGLGVAGLGRGWQQHQIAACQNNLSKVSRALEVYSENHQGAYPRVQDEPPFNVAGMTLVALQDAGVLGSDVSVTCPANGQRSPGRWTAQELDELREQQPEKYGQVVRGLWGCYAYSLGYRVPEEDGGQFYGLVRGQDDNRPIMADRPPFTETSATDPGNSPNHGRRGQNVLFIGGHVKFLTGRNWGADTDIFRNNNNEVGAGLNRQDTVLGASWACP